MNNVDIKQIRREFGGYNLNFPTCFKNNNDSKNLNFSNFYLTSEQLLTDICINPANVLKSNTIITKLKYSNSFLNFKAIDPTAYIQQDIYKDSLNYGVGIFLENEHDNFYINFLDSNRCNIYFTQNHNKFYLTSDVNNNVFFTKDILLSFSDTTINPQDFTYLFSETTKNILFFKKNQNGNYILIKNYNRLELRLNIVDYFDVPFEIDRNIYTYPNTSFNTSFITYDNSNNIDYNKSKFELLNNFLLHKPILNTSTIDIICLKNQLTQLDVFSCSNNLLSGGKDSLYVDEHRAYTNIFQDVLSEKDDELKLNYVFYNKPYIITPGVNLINSPETLYPYSRLNINDTKFVDTGSFSFISPKFSDKIYEISENKNHSNNGQTLLCTWLSGNPQSEEKIWVDRYYYPDLISKEAALVSTPSYDSTYDDYIENLILSNSDLKDAVSDIKLFDKRSDFCFEANKTYEYHRIDIIPETIIPVAIQCSDFNYPPNYFKKINDSGKFSISFYFDGDRDSSWVIKSDRNDIDCELSITKNKDNLTVIYNLYDPTTENVTSYTTTSKIVTAKYNLFACSLNAMTGEGYVFLNSNIIYNFSITPYNYLRRQILYGDFFLKKDNINYELITYNLPDIKNVQISDDYLDPSYLYLLSSLSDRKIDTIYITLPCGMRNSVDDISILSDICNSTSFKSNNMNVIFKNIDDNIDKDDLDSYLKTNLKNVLPATTKINNILYNTYNKTT